jgi:thiamine-monophosphate kinase
MEAEFIHWLRARAPGHPELILGIGDDAAVLRPAGPGGIVVTSDMLMDGVDFVMGACRAEDVGRKALGVNLSDLAAMACRPLAIVVSVALPRLGAGEVARDLYTGILALAAEFGVALAGGDTNTWDGPLVISITALGQCTARGPLRRDGAQPGDAILVTGRFGGSILGRHFTFTPRVREALALHEQYTLHAGIDVSDGLSLDLHRLAAASGCGAALVLESIPLDPAAGQLAAQHGNHITPLEHALSDGEDFELILTLPQNEAERLLHDQPLSIPLTRIGQIVPEPGLWQRLPKGTLEPLTPRGFVHHAVRLSSVDADQASS